MKIQYVHNYYQHKGGEDTVVSNEIELLQKAGHEVDLYSISNDSITGVVEKAKALVNVSYSTEQRKRFRSHLNHYQPDVVHVHNFFPLLTPSVFDAANEADIPTVMTLHNYRLICAGAMLMRNGQPCEDCVNGSPYQAVIHKCYKNSLPGSLALANMISTHRKSKTWSTKVGKLIALTSFAKSRFVNAGFSDHNIEVKPNFISSTRFKQYEQRTGALFVGRISSEKGIHDLVAAWDDCEVPLTIAGDGPLLSSIPDNPRISVLGSVSHSKIQMLMKQAQLLIVPSIWYEGFPMVIVEAFANGLPVASSDIGSLSEVVRQNETGYHFRPGSPKSLADTVNKAFSDPAKLDQLSLNARREYEACYTPEKNLEQLEKIYASVMGQS